jgi:hypothetical protein
MTPPRNPRAGGASNGMCRASRGGYARLSGHEPGETGIMSNHRHIGLGVLLLALVLFASAHAQPLPEVREELQRRGQERGLTPEQVQSILDRASQLEARGLPAASVLDRYLEGLSRGVPLPRIESVVDQLETRLRDSAQRVDLVFPPVQDPNTRAMRLVLIDHCAYAMSVGVPADGLDQAMRLAASGNEGPAAGRAPVLAMSCLMAGGLDASSSLELVRSAWRSGYRGRDLERLGRDLGGLGAQGQGPPPDVLRQVRDSLHSGADRETMLRRLEELRDHEGPGPGQHGPPGMRPGDDPSDMRGPGGPPQDPGHHGPGGPPPHHP